MALVTGSGRAARAFVDEGAFVFIVGPRQSGLDAATAEIGRNVTGIQADVVDLDTLDRVMAQVRPEKGSLDIIVSSAGRSSTSRSPRRRPRISTGPSRSTRGVCFTVAKALPLLNDGASIVLVASGMNMKGLPS